MNETETRDLGYACGDPGHSGKVDVLPGDEHDDSSLGDTTCRDVRSRSNLTGETSE
jgi:hypothetical protein